MTSPTPVPVVPIPVVAGVLATVPVKVLSVNTVDQTASIRVIDLNGNFLASIPAVSLPLGVVTATEFAVTVGDVLEQNDAKQTTGVVRWTDGVMWSPSPSGAPAYSTAGWRKIGNVTIPA